MFRRLLCCLVPLAALVFLVSTFAAERRINFDWPQWQGPERTAVSHETGLLQDWPKDGPPLLWKADNVGGGFSTPSVAQGRVFGMGFRGNDEIVWALDEKTGAEVWAVKTADANQQVGYNEGPRCTPTVDGERLYVLGLGGDLVCLKSQNGEEVWRKNLSNDFGGKVGGWGYSESLLVDGDKVLCTPGAKNTLVALNKKTGETIWKGAVPQGDEAHYSSIIAADYAGQRIYIQFLSGGVVGLSGDGEFLWRYDHPHNGTANCSTPLFHDGCVFAASAYGTGGGLVKLSKDASGGVKADEVYFKKEMQNHHGGMVLVGDYLYGSGEGRLICLEFKTGHVQWDERRPGKGSIAYADGRLYYRNENGPMILIEANPKEYVEHGRFTPPRTGKPAWPHPVIANGKLLLRDQQYLYCYDVKRK
jgi:outer membrane protein assembly factor BamB